MQTDFNSKCVILADLWINYGHESEFRDFVEFNDIGLPLAYFTAEKLCTINDAGARFVDETFDLFLESLGIEDTGFEFLDEVLSKAALGDN